MPLTDAFAGTRGAVDRASGWRSRSKPHEDDVFCGHAIECFPFLAAQQSPAYVRACARVLLGAWLAL